MRHVVYSLLILIPFHSLSQDFSKRNALNLQAEISSNQQSIKLFWSDDLLASSYDVYRRNYEDTIWDFIETVKAPSISFMDHSVNAKTAYEYLVYKKTSTDVIGYGLVLAGINLDPIQSQGTVILMVEDSILSELKGEIDRLIEDLTGEGWLPKLLTVNKETGVKALKKLISEVYKSDKSLTTVILIGNIQVPYSGLIAPDGHFSDHQGAWPSDGYFGDMDGNWTDKTVNSTKPTRTENINLPFDGKFDQSTFPSKLELIIGRIYLENLNKNAGFNANRMVLYKNYLDKNHKFRTGEYQPQQKAMILNGLSKLEEGFAAMGYRYFPQIIDADSLIESSSFDDLTKSNCLISYSCGYGSYSGLKGIVTSTDFAENEYNSVFLGLLGSYFGDWDNENNLLRAPLAGKNPSLVAFWSGRPNWDLHEFAAGLPIGRSLINCQNNKTALLDWPNSSNNESVHISLMGDPTLKARYSKPISNLQVSSTDMATVQLSWTSQATNSVYYVYRRTKNGTYTQLNECALDKNTYVDSFPDNGANYYEVRASKPKSQGFANLSQGVFAQIEGIERETVSYGKRSQNAPIFQIFPNPANQFISINTSYPIGSANFEIRNAAGKLVEQSNFDVAKTFPYQIDLTDLPTGCYILKIKRGNKEPIVGRFYKI